MLILVSWSSICDSPLFQVVDEFQQRERKIARLAKEVRLEFLSTQHWFDTCPSVLQISSRESDIENKDSRINDLKQRYLHILVCCIKLSPPPPLYRWLEPLKDLISRVNACFSSYFSTHMGMESAGMVQLDPDPEEHPNFSEFDKFGVMIKVKFRNVEELQELNAQRQSGGERSVSTMLYLMALQVRKWLSDSPERGFLLLFLPSFLLLPLPSFSFSFPSFVPTSPPPLIPSLRSHPSPVLRPLCP